MQIEQKINIHIKNSHIPTASFPPYDLSLEGLKALKEVAARDLIDGLYLAYTYGLSKGFRMARRVNNE